MSISYDTFGSQEQLLRTQKTLQQNSTFGVCNYLTCYVKANKV